MIKKLSKNKVRVRKHARVRKKIRGTSDIPRLCVYRSNSNIYAQIIDDDEGKTLVQASSKEKACSLEKGGNVEAAKEIGQLIAQRAKDKGIENVVFDRSGYIYHGRIAALANAAREGGLKF